MSEDSIYQQLRGQPRLPAPGAAAARRCPASSTTPVKNKLGHTAFLRRLLEVEVAATEARRAAASERFARLPAPWAGGGLRLRRPAGGGQGDDHETGHAAVLGGRHQRACSSGRPVVVDTARSFHLV